MTVPVSRDHNGLSPQKILKDSKVSIDSAFSICQEATLLTCNSEVQSCCLSTPQPRNTLATFAHNIIDIERKLQQLTDSTKNRFEKAETIQHILKQLQHLSVQFQPKD